ncbi:inner membrane protein translocase component YidC, long form [Aquipluma nitroreducens]|uniref:Membrane protein insertase YidC n=1 Tax=Aquipluma nitroreducens TaxID=2010828 RepID=A0A5K7S313_9BACT|nr:membrane protein insertase YidC [Aquipluma nitroreducens]BBE15942.1 inner membrane protein translocase component YidC, long form [Aquipluma nitroreducens]
MDRNTILGAVLIFSILIGFSYFNKPSEKQLAAAKHQRDSIALVRADQEKKVLSEKKLEETQTVLSASTNADSLVSGANQVLKEKFGVFAEASVGKEKFYSIENNLVKVTLSNKGGRIYSVELKNFKTFEGKPLILFEGTTSKFGMNFFAQNRSIETESFYFVPSDSTPSQVITGPEVKIGREGMEKFNTGGANSSKTVSMRLMAGDGKYLEYKYSLSYNSYLVGFEVNTKNLSNVITTNSNYLNFNWKIDVPRQERKSKMGEDNYSTIYYKFQDDDVEKLSTGKSGTESLRTKTKWVSFKQLFFASTLIADDAFPTVDIKTELTKEDPRYVGKFNADVAIPYEGKDSETIKMKFYFGPSHYTTLKQYDLSMEKQINLGYVVVRQVNQWIIIPTFNFLRRFISNFGIIILLLTVFIKLLIFPFTYKSYHSQAKMKALKPEIDEINAKFGKDKPMEKQQATMALYKKAGVNPMGGCLPMLFQFPVLIAMFFFFPTSIELRQQSFLWATDLSTFDSIWNMPFTIPFYGSHVSLFCLLMTITTIISTYMNSQTQNTEAMPGMKTMMYIMPVMFLFILNSYASGLSYYYFLANVFTIGQIYVFRMLIDEDKIRAQIMINKKKPVVKSKFQQKLEEMSKQQGVKPRK